MARDAGHKRELDDLEKTLDDLRRRFDLFFQGSKEQRTPPTTGQAQFAGLLRKIKEDEAKNWNTQDRFRLNQIHARYTSMERMWARTLKQIEDGTHRRDKFKLQQAKKREEQLQKDAGLTTMGKIPDLTQRPSSLVGDPLDSIDVDMGSFDEDSLPGAQQPARAAAARPQHRAQPAANGGGPGSPGGPSDQRLAQLYKVYMDAKRRTGEHSSLTLDGLRAQISKQVPVLKQKHKCDQVDFKVVLKDGKAMLKAVPK
jgi:hypothetical protein